MHGINLSYCCFFSIVLEFANLSCLIEFSYSQRRCQLLRMRNSVPGSGKRQLKTSNTAKGIDFQFKSKPWKLKLGIVNTAHPFHLEHEGGFISSAILFLCLVARNLLLTNSHTEWCPPKTFPFPSMFSYSIQFCLWLLWIVTAYSVKSGCSLETLTQETISSKRF